MKFFLIALSKSELVDLAASQVPAEIRDRMEIGAMPPPHVAARSIALANAGHPRPWSTTFLIVERENGKAVGSCGFKSFPKDGSVEVGYGVAPGAQRRGAASSALRILVQMAHEAGATEVVAEIVPENIASMRVVQKVGFIRTGSRVDDQNEYVVQWAMRGAACLKKTLPSK